MKGAMVLMLIDVFSNLWYRENNDGIIMTLIMIVKTLMLICHLQFSNLWYPSEELLSSLGFLHFERRTSPGDEHDDDDDDDNNDDDDLADDMV